jgi:YfiH family protein
VARRRFFTRKDLPEDMTARRREDAEQSMSERAEILTSERLSEAGFAHGFPTRRSGVSVGPFASLSFSRPKEPREHVEENLRRLGRAVGFEPGDLFEVSQVHGRAVARRARSTTGAVPGAGGERGADGRDEKADAIVVRGGAAGIRVADCVPVLIGARGTREAAAVHAGWRGVVAGVVGAALAELGPGSKVAAIGPCIGACCFEVGLDVARQIADAVHDPAVIASRSDASGKAMVDLRRAVRLELRAGGLADEDIEDVPGCTMCEPARFFSFRRDGEQSGRHLAVIVSPAPR